MNNSIDITELDDVHEQRNDFRRANGAPMVTQADNPEKWDRYSRPSGYAKCLDDEHALTNWRIWKAMDGVARSKGLQASVLATKEDDKDTKGELREKALDRGEANEKADLGTALHAMTARAEDDSDTSWVAPDEYVDDLRAYTDALARYGLVSEFVEVQMINDEYRAAGTADRIYRLTLPLKTPDGTVLPAGTLVLSDLKTGAKLDFSLPGYAVQMALYATGQFYDVVDNRRIDTPAINQEWVILVHLPVGKATCSVTWLKVEVGNLGAWIAHEVKEWRRKWKNGTYDCIPIEEPDIIVETLIEELGAQVVMDTEMVPKMVKFIQERIAQIAGHTEARENLRLTWPGDLPTPKKGLSKPRDVVRALDLLDKIEAHYALPFLPDPRAALRSPGHKSDMDRTNEFGLIEQQQQSHK